MDDRDSNRKYDRHPRVQHHGTGEFSDYRARDMLELDKFLDEL